MAAKDLSEILPTSLSLGHGEKVCVFLLAIAEHCNTIQGKKALPLKYSESGFLNVNGEGRGDEEEEEEEEDVGGGVLDESAGVGVDDEDGLRPQGDHRDPDASIGHSQSMSGAWPKNGTLGTSMLIPSIDPALW